MSEHYTTNTESVTRYCPRCNRRTQHTVSAGRVGRCLEHNADQLSQKQRKNRERLEREAAEPRLFP